MINHQKILAVIPARGGSRGLPGKNIRDLCGKPLIAWTIEAALKSGCFDAVMVSTDAQKIADIAKQYGAEVPFLRPPELATETAATAPVVAHALNYYQHTLKRAFDYVVLLQPTSPLRHAADISGAVDLLLKKKADAVISVCEMDHPPQWSNPLPEDLSMKHFLADAVKGKRRQDLPICFRVNGAIYICRVDVFLAERTFYLSDNIYAYVMPRERSVDIDTEMDFRLAEVILKMDSAR